MSRCARYTKEVGLNFEFQHQDFYAGILTGNQIFHLKRVDENASSIGFEDRASTFTFILKRTMLTLRQKRQKEGHHVAQDVHKAL
jgi:hypothetical protein